MTDELLRDLAERFGTPLYVYDLDKISSQHALLRAAFPEAEIHFAVKANALGAILRHLNSLGIGVEALTFGELEGVLRAGIPPAKVLLGGPGHTEELARRAGTVGVGLVSLDSPGAWRIYRDVAAPNTRFLVRVNPGFDPKTHAHMATAAAYSKFGLAPEAAAELAAEVAKSGRLAGFHVHAGSMIRDPEVASAVLAALGPLYDRFEGLEVVDLGGGFAVPEFPLEQFAGRMRAFCEGRGLRLLIEPGRFLVAEAGTLLTRVLFRKPGPIEHLIADAGMAELLRPALYDAKHPVRLLDPGPGGAETGAALQRFDVDGPLCENSDRLARDVELGDVRPGGLLAIGLAGAYGYAMASNYGASLRPAEVVVAGGSARLARRRESVADLWRLEQGA